MTKIRIHLEVLMELLQRNKEDQRCGFAMREKMKWHSLHKKKEKVIKAQWEDEILKASECLGEYLKTKVSSEAKISQCFKTDILCMFAGETGKEGQFVDVVIKEEGDRHN